MKILLNKDEFNYVIKSKLIPVGVLKLIKESKKESKDKIICQISEDDADMIRDLFLDELQIIGFDKEYKLTKEGIIIESLIDKFFC